MKDMGLGLQVSPIQEEVSLEDLEKRRDYAGFFLHKYSGDNIAFKAQINFDEPVRFYAHIEAQYLLPADHDYEAGLPADYADHLKNIRIHTRRSCDHNFEYLFKYYGDRDNLLSLISDDDLRKRCKSSINKVNAAYQSRHEISITMDPISSPLYHMVQPNLLANDSNHALIAPMRTNYSFFSQSQPQSSNILLVLFELLKSICIASMGLLLPIANLSLIINPPAEGQRRVVR